MRRIQHANEIQADARALGTVAPKNSVPSRSVSPLNPRP